MKFFGLTLATDRGIQKAVDGAVQKTLADLQAWMRGDDVTTGGAELRSAFNQSTWVFSCIGAIAKQLAQIPLRVSRGARTPMRSRARSWRKRATGEDLVESGPLVDLLNRPHPQLSRFDFWYLCVAWLMLRGEVFASPTTEQGEPVDISVAGRGGKQIKRLTVLSPDNIREEVDANTLLAWCYYGDSRTPMPTYTFLPEEMIYSKFPDPYYFWRGMGPLQVATLPAQTDYASAQFMKGLMQNNADTGVIVTTDQQPSPEQREAILAALRERKRKAGTADRPLFLWGGSKVEKPTISSADMQFLENRKFNRQEICAIFQVPQEVLGFTEDANRSVSDSARLNFIENTVMGVAELLETGFEPLAKAFDRNAFIWFDVDSLPIMQRARQTRFATAGQAMTGMGVPLNTVNDLFDLGLPGDLPHGDIVFLPFSLQEFGAPTPAPAPAPADQQAQGADPISRAMRLFRAIAQPKQLPPPHICKPNPEFEASIQPSIKIKKGKLSKFFFEQRNRVLTGLPSALNYSEPKVAVWTDRTGRRAIDDVFNMAEENARLLKTMKPLLISDLEFGGAQLWKEIGLSDFALKPEDAIKFLDKRANEIKSVNETTWNAIKSTLQDGLSAGESNEQLTDRVKAVYNDASVGRADTIAVTETNVAVNSGRDQAMKDAKVERKGWQTSNLENTRATHLANQALSETQNGIPIDDVWPNGCKFPGDPDGAPGETINCRCFGYAVIPKNSATTAPIPRLLRYDAWLAGKQWHAS